MDNIQLTDQAERGLADTTLPPYTPPSQSNSDILVKSSELPTISDKKAEAGIDTKDGVLIEKKESTKKESAVAGKQKTARKRASLNVRFNLWYNTYRFLSGLPI